MICHTDGTEQQCVGVVPVLALCHGVPTDKGYKDRDFSRKIVKEHTVRCIAQDPALFIAEQALNVQVGNPVCQRSVLIDNKLVQKRKR